MKLKILICLLLTGFQINAQLLNPLELNTAANGVNNIFPIGSLDTNWYSANGNTTGPTSPFVPSIVVGNCAPGFWYNSPFLNANWIAYDFGAECTHSGCVDLFFRRNIYLPTTNECGQAISDNFCLAMDFFADNSVYEIKVNGISNYLYSLGADPYNYVGYQNITTVNLCEGWQAGLNSLIVHIKSCPFAEGFLAQANINIVNTYYYPFTIAQTICEGDDFLGFSSSGVYIDTLQAANGCNSIRTINLTVIPNSTTNQSITICQGEVYEGYSLSGTYTDIFTAANGCDSTRTLNLEVYETYETSESITICEDSTYNFYDINISAEGIYTVSLNTIFGCDSVFILEVMLAGSNFLGRDTTLCNKKEYLLTSPSSNTIWFDNDISQSKRVNSSGLYWASIIDANGCEITDSIYVQFNLNSSYVPNVFSPNADGINDCFTPFFSEGDEITKYRFSVFDRWGGHVFSTTNISDCWNGECRGKECVAGVYVYFIEIYTEYCGRTLLKGDLTLIK